ncbi:MAG TPA: ATP-binding protein [Bryobacteraceae bacterium]|nr:ATP-binding protein [Bryobacteraceae bacterium]HOQ47344.1 ATP-binding protein [Bryobacteraceae bacterium]HPU73871.1 ATP-binding protein [Bryobacteraceae bacterium]
MSLTTRLRLFIIALMVSVISALSALYLYSLGGATFDDILRRAQVDAQQVKNFMDQRLREKMAQMPPPADIEETKRLWTELISTDAEFAQFLENWTANTQVIIEILVADANGRILADSIPSRVGHRVYPLPDFTEWVKKSLWARLIEIFSQMRDYEVTLPLGVAADNNQPVFTIKVVLSSVFLRGAVYPYIRSIALIFLGALLLSMLLAVVVSNLALRPLAGISKTIDRISRGEFAKHPLASESKEYAAVQSKLNLLGQQFHGARQDAIQLRSNIEQLLEKLEEVVFLFDRDDKLVMAGRAAERLLGRGRWEIMGRSLTELFPPTSALGVAIRNAIELRQPLKDLPLTFERDGGQSTRLLVNVEMLEAFPDHQRIGTLITLRDAETRRQIQSQLDVSARLAAISRLTGGVAHEIKNPLQAITVHLELLRSKLAREFDIVEPEIDTIAREIQRLDRVVKTFLDFTRPIDLKMAEVEMASLAREVEALVKPSAERQKVRVELDIDPSEVWVHGDRDLLQQAVLNVVVNGVEAMKNGGRLGIELRQTNGECCLTISDEGVGIPPEIREKIFNLYYSTKGKGSGIGLAMTFRVIQLHNGTIDFTSEPGKGTTFRLRLPAIEKEPLRSAYTTAGDNRPGR